MILRSIESQLSTLSAAEKAEVIQWLSHSIGDQWPGIEKTPGVCGGDARVENTRIPVWVLVQARSLGSSEIDLLQNYPALNASHLANVWAYAAKHTEEIEKTIRENNEA